MCMEKYMNRIEERNDYLLKINQNMYEECGIKMWNNGDENIVEFESSLKSLP